MTERVSAGGLQVAKTLHEFIENTALPGTGVASDAFWQGFGAVVTDLAPLNRALLAKREQLQAQIDEWCLAHRGRPLDMPAYKAFLSGIGYLVPEGAPFSITTEGVDDEIARIAGPQLVVPVNNARYALNAANARWGSLYDAFYGTDVIPEDGGLEKGLTFNARRGAAVVARVAAFLDDAVPLTDGSHADRLRRAIFELPVRRVLEPDERRRDHRETSAALDDRRQPAVAAGTRAEREAHGEPYPRRSCARPHAPP